MDKITLLLLHDEENKEYSVALGKAISNLHNDFDLTISMCNSNQKDFDLILICGWSETDLENPSTTQETNLFQYPNYKIYLSEEPVDRTPQDQVPRNLFKYSRVQELVSDLRYAYSILTGKKKMIKTPINSKLLGFYSICGGSGKTAVCISVAHELAKYYDKKVLYLSLEEIEATTYYLDTDEGQKRNISDFLYYLFNNKNQNICTFIENFTFSTQYGVEAFYPSKGINELTTLTNDELFYFIDFLGNCKRYDYILMDLSNTLNTQTLELIDSSCKTLIIEKEDFVSVEKNKKLMNYFNHTKNEKFNDCLMQVRNMVGVSNENREIVHNKGGAEEEQITSNLLQIQFDRNSFLQKESRMEILMDNEFGMGIKEVVSRILES